MLSEGIKAGLDKYKRKLYLRRLSKGVLLTLSFFIFLFILINSLEAFFWFDESVRLFLFLTLVIAFIVPFAYMVLIPIFELIKLKRGITEHQIAKDIGKFFPEVNDRLLNLLELNELSTSRQALVVASIEQKEKELQVIDFSQAINLNVNFKYLYWFVAAMLLLVSISILRPQLIKESSSRILKFNTQFERPAPFQFLINNESLEVFRNEDFELNVTIDGNQTPDAVYVIIDNTRKVRINQDQEGIYSYIFNNIQTPIHFQMEGAGYQSKEYELVVLNRPEIDRFDLILDYPSYTNMEDETLENIGSAIVPEGTAVTWKLRTRNTSKAFIQIDSTKSLFKSLDNEHFTLGKTVSSAFQYDLIINNEHGNNLRPISYSIDIIKDNHPQIEVAYQVRFHSLFFCSYLWKNIR